MQPTISSAAVTSPAPAIKYWEDLQELPVSRYGPVVFSSQLLDQLLELMGEKHPIHQSDGFARETARRQRIIPGGFIHSITSGWIVQHTSPLAIIGMRSMYWDFVRPLYPDVPFYFSTETTSAEPIDSAIGVINSTRRVFNEAGQVYAIGRLSGVVKRRPQEG